MISLTPQRIAAIYDCLRQFHPFTRWGLPESDAVEFRVAARKDVQGEFARTKWDRLNGHRITVSYINNHHYDSVVRTIAHEMIHQAQEIAGTSTKPQYQHYHNEDFKKRAHKVCKAFGFDEGQF